MGFAPPVDAGRSGCSAPVRNSPRTDVALTLTGGHALRVPTTGLPATPARWARRGALTAASRLLEALRVNGLARRLCLYEAMRFVIAGASAVGGFVAARP